MKKCPTCKSENSDDTRFCKNCGENIVSISTQGLPSNSYMVRCPKCGESNPSTTRYCARCGQPLTQEAADQLSGGRNQTVSVKKKSHGCLIAFLVCVIIFIIGLVLLIGISGYLNKASGSSANAGAQNTSVETTEYIPHIGEVFRVGQIAYRVDKVEVSNTVGGEYINSTAKGTYLLVTLTITNNSSDPLTISDSFFTILYNGKKYSADSAATIYADSKNSLWYDSINPDLTTTGVVAFDVSTEVANSPDTQLQVQTGFWGTQTGIISLSR